MGDAAGVQQQQQGDGQEREEERSQRPTASPIASLTTAPTMTAQNGAYPNPLPAARLATKSPAPTP